MTYIDPIKMWHYDTRQHHPVATSYGFLGVCAQMLAESSDSQLTDVVPTRISGTTVVTTALFLSGKINKQNLNPEKEVDY